MSEQTVNLSVIQCIIKLQSTVSIKRVEKNIFSLLFCSQVRIMDCHMNIYTTRRFVVNSAQETFFSHSTHSAGAFSQESKRLYVTLNHCFFAVRLSFALELPLFLGVPWQTETNTQQYFGLYFIDTCNDNKQENINFSNKQSWELNYCLFVSLCLSVSTSRL